MACFTVPAAEAIVTTIITKAAKSSEAKLSESERAEKLLPFSKKLGWLNGMLWGGSALLALEHIWHGEIVPVFPFFTGEMSEVLGEMATTGVLMSVAVTAVWGGMVLLSSAVEKRIKSEEKDEATAQ